MLPRSYLRGFSYSCVRATQDAHLGSAWISALTCSTSGTVHQGHSLYVISHGVVIHAIVLAFHIINFSNQFVDPLCPFVWVS